MTHCRFSLNCGNKAVTHSVDKVMLVVWDNNNYGPEATGAGRHLSLSANNAWRGRGARGRSVACIVTTSFRRCYNRSRVSLVASRERLSWSRQGCCVYSLITGWNKQSQGLRAGDGREARMKTPHKHAHEHLNTMFAFFPHFCLSLALTHTHARTHAERQERTHTHEAGTHARTHTRAHTHTHLAFTKRL